MTATRESVSSIQLALELEHQLNDHHDSPQPSSAMDHSYDPEVLTSIIIQLRANLATVTQERDESVQAIADSSHKNAALEAQVADLQETMETERARADKAESERDAAVKAAQESDEQVNMLRAKVEESRRGIMRLQAESRRMSVQTVKTGPLPLDLSAVSSGLRSPGFSSGFPTSKSAKRASFQLPSNPPSTFSTPGSSLARPSGGHRRISSLSDPGQLVATGSGGGLAEALPIVGLDGMPPSPATHTFEETRNGDGSVIKTKRLSLIARRDISPPAIPTGPTPAEMEALQEELAQMKKALESAQHELAEAKDKRDASEAAIKSLRAFIAEQAMGDASSVPSGLSEDGANSMKSPVMSLKGLRLPPLPTEDNIPDEQGRPTAAPKRGWGLRLWKEKENTPGIDQQVQQTPTIPPPVANTPASEGVPSSTSTPLTSFVSSWTRSVSNTSTSSSSTQPTPTPPAVDTSNPINSLASTTTAPSGLRKFGFFTPKPVSSPSVASVPELTHSESTSPRSLTSGALSEEDNTTTTVDALGLAQGAEKVRGDLTPTLSSTTEEETMEAVAL